MVLKDRHLQISPEVLQGQTPCSHTLITADIAAIPADSTQFFLQDISFIAIYWRGTEHLRLKNRLQGMRGEEGGGWVYIWFVWKKNSQYILCYIYVFFSEKFEVSCDQNLE